MAADAGISYNSIMKLNKCLVSSCVLACLPAGFVFAEDPTTAAVEVRMHKPERQLAEVLRLFEGTKVASPAEALSKWKSADAARTLGKPLEAVISLFNPLMVNELKNLDDSVLFLNVYAGKVSWSAVIPRDDGSFAALGPALALTEGGPEPPFEGATIHRLGPPGGPLMSQRGSLLAFATERPALEKTLQSAPVPPKIDVATGWTMRVIPSRIKLEEDSSENAKLVIAALRAIEAKSVDSILAIEAGILGLHVRTELSEAWAVDRPTVDPSWLDLVPRKDLVVAFALAIEASPKNLDRLFVVFDQVEKSQADRANVAPARARLNLIAFGRGVNLETDFWPGLIGLSGFLTEGNDTLVALHFRNDSAAGAGEKLVGKLGKGANLSIVRHGSSIWVANGAKVFDLARNSLQDKTLRLERDPAFEGRVERFVSIRPSHVPGIVIDPMFGDFGRCVWIGRSDGSSLTDQVTWDGAREIAKQILARHLGD